MMNIEDSSHKSEEEVGNQDNESGELVAQGETQMQPEEQTDGKREEELDENKAQVTAAKDSSTVEGEEKRAEEEKDGGQIVIIHNEEGKEPIIMSIWVWEAVLKFITRMEMAERVSLVCHALKKLCWPRLHGKMVAPHMVETLCFQKGDEENGQTEALLCIWKERARSGVFDVIPIPIANSAPPPNYIQGFESINIHYLDAEVLKFIRNIRPLLANLRISIGQIIEFDDLRKFMATLNGCSMAYLSSHSSFITILQWRQNFPGLLQNIPTVAVDLVWREDWLEMNELISAKLANGKPFHLKLFGTLWDAKIASIPIDNIQKAFQTATRPQSFLIDFSRVEGLKLDVFRMENDGTGESLTLKDEGYSCYKLYRCPRGEGEQKWLKEAEDKFTYKEEMHFSVTL